MGRNTKNATMANLSGAGGGRRLHENPDQTIQAELTSCAGCGEFIPSHFQPILQRYDKVACPPIKPIVTRAERYGCVCSDPLKSLFSES